MDPWAVELVKDLAGVLIGWALGLGTAVFVESRKERKRIRGIKAAVALELQEIAHRLLLGVFKTESRCGTVNRELLEWMLPLVQRYAGPNPKEGVLAGVAGLLKRSDEELAALAAHEKATTPPQFWPREEAPYTSIAAAQAHDLEPEYAVRLLDVLSHIRMLEDLRENQMYYSRLTFAPGITDENHEKAVRNADAAEEQRGKRARIIITKISKLLEDNP